MENNAMKMANSEDKMSSTFGGTQPDQAGSSQERANTSNFKRTGPRKKIPRPPSLLLLLSGLLLAWAGSALAATIDLNGAGVTYNLSTLGAGSGDTIWVHNGATLGVDTSQTIAGLTIGDATTPGNVLFDNVPASPRTLTVSGDVVFNAAAGNVLDMAHNDPFVPPHVLSVQGNFLASGAGTFAAGNGTVNYSRSGAQTVTAAVGGTTLQYKNLTLSGSGTKTFAATVSIQAVLTIAGTAVPAGTTPTYGPLASIVYAGSAAQTTTATEWPNAPAVLNVPVTLNNSSGLTLNADKTISALLTLTSGNLNDGGKTLTLLGNMVNNTKHLGTGKILLAGTSAQTLSGNGSYGNVTLLGAGATLTSTVADTVNAPKIAGRLILTGTGKLTIPLGQNQHVSLLSYGSPLTDRAANTYGATTAPAAIQDDTYFQDGSAMGIITVNPKPQGVIVVNSADQNQSITYGQTTIHVRGTVKPPTGPGPDFSLYGNTALAGENVIVTIMPPAPYAYVAGNAPIQADNQSFDVTVDVSSLPTGFKASGGTPGGNPLFAFNMSVRYDDISPRPLNLAGNILGNPPPSPSPLSLLVNRVFIVVTPENIGKVYGTPDSALMVDPYLIPWSGPGSERTLPFTFTTGALQYGDTWVGHLGRTPGENVGAYAINQGTFHLSDNYDLWFITGKALTIIQKPITVIPDANQAKVYGTLPDPKLTFTTDVPLVPGDSWTGALTRDKAGLYPPDASGERVGTYAVLKGNLAVSCPTNYIVSFTSGVNFTITKLHVVITMRSDSKVYGENDPSSITSGVLSIKGAAPPYIDYTGALPFGDTTTGNPARDAGENAGSYAVRQGTFALSPAFVGNYIVNAGDYVLGTFTITKRPVIITATVTTKYYGDNLPAFYTFEAVSPGRGLILPPGRTGLGPAPGSIPGQTGTIPLPTLTWSPSTPTICSLPGVYTFALSGANDPNYAPTFIQGGQMTIVKAPMKIVADNKTKVGNSAVFDPRNFTSTYWVYLNGVWTQEFVGSTPQTPPGTPNNCGDTAVSAFNPNGQDGLLAYADNFQGTAVTATLPGVYEIRPYITGSPPNPASDRFDVSFVSGYLTITPQTLPAVQTVGSIIWGAANPGCDIDGDMVNLAWYADDPGNNSVGTAGGEPGWSLLTVNGSLTINATPACPFRLDLVTLGSPTPGRMAMFDPTRPYQWLIVHTTGGISGFDPSKIVINYAGSPLLPPGAGSPAYLFANPIFGGRFDVRVSGNDMILYFTPVGPTGGINLAADPPPIYPTPAGYVNGGAVGPITDTTTLLGDTTTHGVPTLYLLAGAGGPMSITPQTSVTINLNVADLGTTDIYGVQAYINFDSRFFNAGTGAGAPQVVAGGGVWTEVITKQWNVGGDLDTVIGISLGNLSVGTRADATVAQVTLTPTRAATGTSRVVFRHDGDPALDGSGALQTLLIRQPGQTPVLPARIMSDEITVINDTAGPVIGTITATQVQPYSDPTKALPAPVNVKSPPVGQNTVRTFGGIPNAEATTATGPVVITIPVVDTGVGLLRQPTVVLTKGVLTVSSDVPGSGLVCLNPGVTGPFVYQWIVPVGADGTWSAEVSATDTVNCPACTPPETPNTTDIPNAFTLVVNTYQVTGVVELEMFAGTNRTVTFKAGDGNPATPILATWSPNLNFISAPILNAGAYQNRQSLANKLVTTPDPLSLWLRYGAVLDLPGMVARLRNQPMNVDKWIDLQIYGDVANLQTLADKLSNPTRRIDEYGQLKLSPSTMVALAAYQAAALPKPQPLADALKQGILDDFNKIVAGHSIWDPVRFTAVVLSPATVALLGPPITTDTVALNRSLLVDAFPEYIVGKLQPQVGVALTDYAGGANPALEALLLKAFDTLTLTPSMWPAPTPPYGACLYNELVFVGVSLAADTHALLTALPFPAGTDLTQLNQDLLRDAYTEFGPPAHAMYQIAQLRPDTVLTLNLLNVPLFEADMQRDLNKVIYGPSVYTAARFAPWIGAVIPGSELDQLLHNPTPSPAQLVRLNRLLLELGLNEGSFNTVLSASVLAPYVLVNAPSATTQLSAKTAWNLRERLDGLVFNGVTLDTVAYFVNDGVPGWTPGGDHYLRGGDIYQDVNEAVSLADYNVMRLNYNQPVPAADINGDGVSNIQDYMILKHNWAKTGMPEVQ